MTIIIGAGPEPAAPNPLPTADVDLPPPASVPENHRLLNDAQLTNLLTHDHPLVRAFAIEQVSTHPTPERLRMLISRFSDEDEGVAVEAITTVDRERFEPATDALLEAFATATGHRTAALAGALAMLAPERLLEAVQARGRLDDRAYRSVASALALTGTEPVRRFLDKALNRSGALAPDRKSALYTAVLLSGDVPLTTRVLTKAVDDSKQEAPDDSMYPSRAAMATIAGLPATAARSDPSGDILKHSRTIAERDLRPALDEAEWEALDEAFRHGYAVEILGALEPIVTLTDHPDETRDERPDDENTKNRRDERSSARSLTRRRRGLLTALIARADDVAHLDAPFAALFVGLAIRTAAIAIGPQVDESKSEGMTGLAKILEEELTPAFAEQTEDEWKARFAQKSPREIRGIVTVVVRQPFRRTETLERICRALTTVGHGRALLGALAEVEADTGLFEFAVRAMAADPVAAEALVVEVLTETPLPEDELPIALLIGAVVRTERIGVALGRRYYDIRRVARTATTQVLLRIADPRLTPLLESRAFADEPEETAWMVLALIEGQASSPRLEAALKRHAAHEQEQAREHGANDDHEPKLEVLLKCEVCEETLRYRFDRAYVDPEAKDQMGDPAFVGPMVCKACGTADRLQPVPETAMVLTQHMMAFLQAAQAGHRPTQPPLVTPGQTRLGGRNVGLAAALRNLDEAIAANPDSIRTRLHRARTRMVLKRSGIEEDLEAAQRLDPDAVEADALRVAVAIRDRDFNRGAELAIATLKRLKAPPEPRIYDAEDIDEVVENLENYLLDLTEMGTPLPEDVDLRAAQRQRELERAALRQAEREAAERSMEDETAPESPRGSQRDSTAEPEASSELVAAFKTAGRNDPCPCGSGKKFKRCHGK